MCLGLTHYALEKLKLALIRRIAKSNIKLKPSSQNRFEVGKGFEAKVSVIDNVTV